MASDQTGTPSGPDFEAGIDFESLQENKPLAGHFHDEAVMLVRQGEEVFAIGATCTHYGGPLAEGLVVGTAVHCPWHHARFCLRTGEATGAPALNPVSCFEVLREGGRVRVSQKRDVHFRIDNPKNSGAVVIIGGGAAGAACADMLRAKGYGGAVTLVGDEEPGPVDRPNLSKDYLAGTAPEEWIPLRTREYYQSIQVDAVIGDAATRIDCARHEVTLRSGRKLPYGKLVLATGASPRSLSIEGAGLPHVHRLRTLADSRAIIAAAEKAKQCVVIGASFIGLEVAASLRHRGLEVTVVGQEQIPLAKVLGDEIGRFIQGVHEKNGVRFILGTAPAQIHEKQVELKNGQAVSADLVVLGVGVSPRTELAEDAGLAVDNGVLVDENLRTSDPDIYAAGDIARYPEPMSGERARIEHWVLAERQGQAVARQILGIGTTFQEPPFFWSLHHDVTISYLGHASSWNAIEIRGDLAQDACAIYRKAGRAVAIATINRDMVNLKAEAAWERGDIAGLESLLKAQ